MSILTSLLKKRGITSPEQLTNDEKADFDRWNAILSQGEMSVDKILEFCKHQKQVIENQWTDLDNSSKKNDRLITMHTVYSRIIGAIEAPKAERDVLEKQLQAMIENG